MTDSLDVVLKLRRTLELDVFTGQGVDWRPHPDSRRRLLGTNRMSSYCKVGGLNINGRNQDSQRAVFMVLDGKGSNTHRSRARMIYGSNDEVEKKSPVFRASSRKGVLQTGPIDGATNISTR